MECALFTQLRTHGYIRLYCIFTKVDEFLSANIVKIKICIAFWIAYPQNALEMDLKCAILNKEETGYTTKLDVYTVHSRMTMSYLISFKTQTKETQ